VIRRLSGSIEDSQKVPQVTVFNKNYPSRSIEGYRGDALQFDGISDGGFSLPQRVEIYTVRSKPIVTV
jgi:hypothetical protein